MLIKTVRLLNFGLLLIHELLFFVLQMLNRLTKSAEIQARVDEEYFLANTQGHQMRLKWENTLKNCYQVKLK